MDESFYSPQGSPPPQATLYDEDRFLALLFDFTINSRTTLSFVEGLPHDVGTTYPVKIYAREKRRRQ
jgi:hypothetical protein